MRKAAREHLVHRAVIILPLKGFNRKPLICLLIGYAAAKHDHARYIIAAGRVGNIICFNIFRRGLQAQQPGQLVERGRLLSRSAEVLRKLFRRIGATHLH